MVALNKTYLKTHTPDGSAKDSGYRFYSPEISRWLSRDPIGESGGLDLYVFSANGPIHRLDFLGLATLLIPLPGGGSLPVDVPLGGESDAGDGHGQLTWTGYSEQNCNPGAWGLSLYGNTYGYWHEPDAPPQVRNWNTAYASFGHRCGGWGFGTMCNSQTLLEIAAKNDDCCCSSWTITCFWYYRGEMHSTGGYVDLNVTTTEFLGEIPYPFYNSLESRDPHAGTSPGHHTAWLTVVDEKTTSSPVTIGCGEEITVFYMRPHLTWNGWPDVIKEDAWAFCTGECSE